MRYIEKLIARYLSSTMIKINCWCGSVVKRYFYNKVGAVIKWRRMKNKKDYG